jgi:hypothetical protein
MLRNIRKKLDAFAEGGDRSPVKNTPGKGGRKKRAGDDEDDVNKTPTKKQRTPKSTAKVSATGTPISNIKSAKGNIDPGSEDEDLMSRKDVIAGLEDLVNDPDAFKSLEGPVIKSDPYEDELDDGVDNYDASL